MQVPVKKSKNLMYYKLLNQVFYGYYEIYLVLTLEIQNISYLNSSIKSIKSASFWDQKHICSSFSFEVNQNVIMNIETVVQSK